AKTGFGIDKLLDAVIDRIPCPNGEINSNLRGLIFDSVFDSYRGVVIQTRIVDGKLKVGDKIRFMSTGASHEVTELGVSTPKEEKVKELVSGDVGYVCASIKKISDVKIGDTITLDDNPAKEVLPGYKEIKPMVYSGIYPVETNKYNDLRDALEKLKLNDASLTFEPETSKALGFGFRCGFLGLLHMDIIKERIEREFNIEIILTSPSVIYTVTLTNGDIVYVDNPTKLPDRQVISKIEEPYIKTNIFVPSEFIGPVMELCQNKRGNFINMDYIDTRVNIHYELPLSEIVYGNKQSDLVKVDIMLNGDIVDAFSIITHKDFAYKRGNAITQKLKEIIPRQLFEVPVQACCNNKVIARCDIKANRKNVLAKCYGGDISRKRKLLEKQKEGKKKMKTIGSVELPPEAFLEVLSVED
ncbi:MAG: elongation factor 4, partial [Clostridium sp. CAG_433_25_7]